ncbi:MAG: hypothetical protein ACD_47C00556G0003 [uncultured bacterium]|nr:MAG: hypothetical protein ACD_47C00556G0003 [uncultured bacterium]
MPASRPEEEVSYSSAISSEERTVWSMVISGSIPTLCMERPEGVKYHAVVRMSPALFSIGMTVWMTPFPKVFPPMSMPLLLSWMAPATISEDDAEPLFISTISGYNGCER